ncbi:MAG: SpoIID/LytB domain-containing protein [Firmicutes bacterium]|nr:SpoIID/LytB domain-containing protein [Bacillota bacterium]
MKRKTLLSIILAVIMVFTMVPASFADSPDAGEYYVKVGVKYGSSAPSEVKISAPGGLKLSMVSGNEQPPEPNAESYIELHTSITVVNTDGILEALDDNGEHICYLSGNGQEFISAASYYDDNEAISIDGQKYRGGVILNLNSSSQMDVINYVNSEDYLRGVLHAEIGQSSALEAIKAQAVTARSFLYGNKNKHKSQGFGVCTTTHCQVYKGVSGEYAKTDQAVEETRGIIMYYGGVPVSAYYSANSGGHTQNNEDVWGGSKVGYLRGKKDEFSPEYTWTVKLTKAQLESAVAGKGVGDITSISIDSYNSAGAVASLTVKGTSGTYTVKKDAIRNMFSGTSLKSTMFKLSSEGGSTTSPEGSYAEQSPKASVYAMDSYGAKVKLGSSLFAVSSSGVSKINLAGTHILGADGAKDVVDAGSGDGESPTAVSADTIYLDDDSDVVIFSGRGYGHGVGMSQQGAQVMGKQGYSYVDILEYYFTDVEIK